MKKLALLFSFMMFLSAHGTSQLSEYETFMKTNIDLLFQGQAKENLVAVYNAFERIAEKEKDAWQPLYYGAFAQIMLSTKVESGDEKDKYLDIGEAMLRKAIKISPDNSEIITLQGFIYMLRIPIDPANRGPQFSSMGTVSFYRAIGIDPNNPRAHMLLSDMQFGTAAFMGSNDTREACASLHKAGELFANSRSTSVIDPNWGIDWMEERLKRCE